MKLHDGTTLTADGLAERIRLHKLWRRGKPDGVRLDLRGADLTGADLTGADLTGAVLTGADLTGAVLTRADLTRAVLTGADLTRADLTGAVLTGADLTRAVLTDAVLTDAVLTGAVLTRAVLTRAVLTQIPAVPDLHQRMLEAIQVDDRLFSMTDWHRRVYDDKGEACGTSHCRAGWAVTLAGKEGAALERELGPAAAGALITAKSCPWMTRPPDFFCTDEQALESIREAAAREKAEAKS